jgi:hypothetical protein
MTGPKKQNHKYKEKEDMNTATNAKADAPHWMDSEEQYIPNGMKIIPCTCLIDAPFNCPQHGEGLEWREGREQMKRRAEYIKDCAIATE